MTAAAVRRWAVWVPPLLVLALVCGGAGPAHGREGWAWPLQPTPPVARPFDPPSEEWSAGHRGVDLRGYPGQPVLAPAAGRVVFAADLAGRGVLVVRVGRLRVTFEPVEPAVAVGDLVTPGQVLGRLQTARSHCLPQACLHWGVKVGDDAYIDPLSLVGGADIVLLPFLDPAAPAPTSWTPRAPAAGATPADRAPGPGAAALRFALAQVGDPYVWAAAGPDRWDCSGLTMAAWASAGRPLPHYSAAQYLATTPVTEDRLRPGDLVFWAGGSAPTAIFHVALYAGGGLVVHAPRPGTRVRVEAMRSWAEPDYFGRP
ncbi:MAG: NlpC/P60 family protein [Actinomycetota bacterium]|nr:NlpC/P60 family protein [Actinomycetota bacterium]